jgi:hypothetical protein
VAEEEVRENMPHNRPRRNAVRAPCKCAIAYLVRSAAAQSAESSPLCDPERLDHVSSCGSRTALGAAAGSRTQVYSLIALAALVPVLLFGRGLLANFPDAAPGAP